MLSVTWKLSTSYESLPTRECGLKCDQDISSADGFESLPTRECGLKFLLIVFISSLDTSLPTRECGLKSCFGADAVIPANVTPYAGVWIEIIDIIDNRVITLESLPTRECGLK